jgi:HPt (histidine-containing phosphotransfer) domain-containing protein
MSLLPEFVGEETGNPDVAAPVADAGPVDEVFDRSHLDALAEGEIVFIKRVVNAFRQTRDASIAEIRDAVASGDAGRLDDALHTLKGAVGNLRARATFEAAATLEETGRSGNLEKAPQQLKRLEVELQRLDDALDGLIEEEDLTPSHEGVLVD